MKMMTTMMMMMSTPEYAALGSLVRAIRVNGDVMEIGAGVGGSTQVISEALKDGGSVRGFASVDQLVLGPAETARRSNGKFSDQKAAILSQGGNLWQMSSMEALEKVPNESLSFVLVDGDHIYKNAIMDVQKWAGKVTLGGIMAVHDVGRVTANWDAGPTQAFIEWFVSAINWRMIVQIETLVAVQRMG